MLGPILRPLAHGSLSGKQYSMVAPLLGPLSPEVKPKARIFDGILGKGDKPAYATGKGDRGAQAPGAGTKGFSIPGEGGG